jgi:DNA-binding NarL/FixJ family response regulator
VSEPTDRIRTSPRGTFGAGTEETLGGGVHRIHQLDSQFVEREVVTLVGQGLSNHEIAAALTLSPATARTHVSRSMIKLGARDRAQLVVIAYQTGLVTADTS